MICLSHPAGVTGHRPGDRVLLPTRQVNSSCSAGPTPPGPLQVSAAPSPAVPSLHKRLVVPNTISISLTLPCKFDAVPACPFKKGFFFCATYCSCSAAEEGYTLGAQTSRNTSLTIITYLQVHQRAPGRCCPHVEATNTAPAQGSLAFHHTCQPLLQQRIR